MAIQRRKRRANRPRSIDWLRDRESRRSEIHNRAVQGLFVLNGGGAIAMLAALPQMWEKSAAVVPWIAAGLVGFALGLAFCGWINFLRYESSRAHDRTRTREVGQRYGRIWRCLARLSITMFIVAVAIVAFGMFRNLPAIVTKA